jgi:Tfp pilus assembly protein PilP
VSRHHVATLVSALLAAASAAGAQSMPNINAPIQAARRAAAAENAQLSAQTGQAVPSRSGPPAPAPAAAAPRPAAGAPRPAAGAVLGTGAVPLAGSPQVTREIFLYEEKGRRDPFFSLILTEDLRPLLSDLKLVGVLYEASGRRSVAIFRDLATNAQYRVQTGMALGRMRVAQIKPKGVIFTIDEFGLSRQDSLMLTDSLKARIR